MKIPSDYERGYEKARAIAPEIAAKYIAHTQIGDPLAEAMAADLAELSSEESRRLIQAAMNEEGEEALRDAPSSLRKFFEEAETPPEWLDYSAFAPGVRMFHRNSQVILAAFVAGVLIEGFTTNIAKSFFITGRGARPGPSGVWGRITVTWWRYSFPAACTGMETDGNFRSVLG